MALWGRHPTRVVAPQCKPPKTSRAKFSIRRPANKLRLSIHRVLVAPSIIGLSVTADVRGHTAVARRRREAGYLGDRDDGEDVSFAEGEVLISCAVEIIFGDTFCAGSPDSLLGNNKDIVNIWIRRQEKAF